MLNKVYNDRQSEDIERDVREEFNRIKKLWIRDDQKIYDAWLNVIEKYKDEVLNSDSLVRKERYIVWIDWKPVIFRSWNEYWKAARRYFIEAYNKIVDLHNNVAWLIKFTTDAEDNDLIRKVAIEIDNAENEALRKIEQYCNPMQQWDNASYHSSVKKDNQWNPKVKNWQIEKQKPMFTQDRTWLITFTDRCNNLSFVDTANNSWLFFKNKGRYPQYTIDYTNCKNQKLKDKMKNLTWWYKWTLRYDVSKKTYFIKWTNWIDVKALSIWIYEWITFKRKEIEADEAHEKDQKRKEKLWNVDTQIDSEVFPEDDPELKKYVEDIPEDLRKKLRSLWAKEYRKFIIETENRLATILREYKYYNYELHTNPISNSSSWLFEINFISKEYEKSVKLRENWSKLWSTLYSLFVTNAGQLDCGYGSPTGLQEESRNFEQEYKKYLEKRIIAKWDEVDDIASRKNLIWMDYIRDPNLSDEEKVSPESLVSINYWIYLLKTFIQKRRNKEWDSYIDSDDRNLVGMLQSLQNLESTIQKDADLVPKDRIFFAIDQVVVDLANRWHSYTFGLRYEEPLRRDFKSIIMSDDATVKFNILRSLWSKSLSFWSDWTTAFLAEEISKSDVKKIKFINEEWADETLFYAESRFEINDEELNRRFNYINACLYTEIEFDWNWELKVTPAMRKIDILYKYCNDTSWKKIAEELNKMGILPDSWVNDSDVLDKCKEIAKNLYNKEKNINNNFTLDAIKKWILTQRKKLESKYPRSTIEDEELRKLEYYDNHPNEADLYYMASLKCMESTIRYYWINNEISCLLDPVFVEKGGWAKGKMWEMYNDIIWYWFWDLSDKTAAAVENIIVTIVISTMVWFAVSWVMSFLATYLTEHFSGLVEIIESIKAAVSVKVSKFVASLWWVKWRVVRTWVEILKKYKAWLAVVKGTFIKNFKAWLPLDRWFILNSTTFDSILAMSIAYVSWVVGDFWYLFWEKISECFEEVFANFAEEHPERWDNIASVVKLITERASKEWLKKVKNMVFSKWDNDIVFESNFMNWLNRLDDNLRSWEDKQKLSELAGSKIKFHLSTKVVDSKTMSLNWTTKSINALDALSVVQNLMALKFTRQSTFEEYFEKISNWTFKLHLGTEPWKVYLQDPRTWKIASFSELASWGQLG